MKGVTGECEKVKNTGWIKWGQVTILHSSVILCKE